MARMFSFAFMPRPIVLMCTIENSEVDEDFEIMIERYKYSYFKVIKKRKLSNDQEELEEISPSPLFIFKPMSPFYVLCDGYFWIDILWTLHLEDTIQWQI